MSSPTNPFVFGRILDATEIVDREHELGTLVKRLRQGQRHFLIGPRRYGKSSLLAAAAAQATQAGAPTVLVNAESYTSLNALAGGIVAAASTVISLNLKERLVGVAEWFSAVRPVAEYDAISDSVKVSIAPKDTAPAAQTVAEALGSLDVLAKARGHTIGVIIDEFQVVTEFGGIDAERILRAAVQQHRHLSYVFAGSHTRMLLSMTTEHDRPFYRLGRLTVLGARAAGGVREISSATGSGVATSSIGEDALARVFDLCRDVPVQRAAALRRALRFANDLPDGAAL